MSVSQDQVVDYIKNLKLSEVKDLISTLEDELGVEASAPMAMMAAGPGAAAEAAEAETAAAEEPAAEEAPAEEAPAEEAAEEEKA